MEEYENHTTQHQYVGKVDWFILDRRMSSVGFGDRDVKILFVCVCEIVQARRVQPELRIQMSFYGPDWL